MISTSATVGQQFLSHFYLKLYFVFVREALGVVLHKDSKWYQQWKDFKDNNVVFNSKDYMTFSVYVYIFGILLTVSFKWVCKQYSFVS